MFPKSHPHLDLSLSQRDVNMQLERPLLGGLIMKNCPHADLISGGQGLPAAFNVIIKSVQIGVTQCYHCRVAPAAGTPCLIFPSRI